MRKFSIFVAGAFGGAAPYLLKLGGFALADKLPCASYYLAVLIFAVIGGGVAFIYKESILHKAFFLGIGAPGLIYAGLSAADTASAGKGAPIPPAVTRDADRSSGLNLRHGIVSSAFAEDVPQGKAPSNDVRSAGTRFDSNDAKVNLKDDEDLERVVTLKVSGKLPETTRLVVEDKNGSAKAFWIHVKGDSTKIVLPAKKGLLIRLVTETGSTESIFVPEGNAPYEVKAKGEGSKWSDLFKAAGLVRFADAMDLKSAKIEVVRLPCPVGRVAEGENCVEAGPGARTTPTQGTVP